MKKLKQPAQRFGFIFCNDLHIENEADLLRLESIVLEWKSLDLPWDFSVVCGDISGSASVSVFQSVKRLLKKSGKPFFTLPGNHDCTGPGAEGKKNYESVFGRNRLEYCIIHKGVALVFLDLSYGKDSQVTVQSETVRRLDQTLARIPQPMPLIVFSHFPLHPDTPRFSVQNTDQLFGLLDRRTVLAYFSGHYHGTWQGERKGVRFYTNVRLLPNVKNHQDSPEMGYCVVHVQNSTAMVEYRSEAFR